MPAAVALAIGAVTGALAVGVLPPVAILLVALATCLVAPAARQLGSGPPQSAATGGSRATWLGRVRWLPLGIGVAAIAVRLLAEPVSVSQPRLPTGDGPWTATVVSVGAEHGPTRPAVLRLDDPTGLVVAATLPWFPAVGADDRVTVTGSMRPRTADDYGDYLARIGASGTLRAETLELRPPATGLGRTLEEWRRGAAADLERAVPEPEAGLGAGILIGLRDRVDRQLAADFTTAGVSHVVAISGWNIAIVATTIGAIAGRVGRGKSHELAARIRMNLRPFRT
jgi:predicted membrane metal-binding protein